jgi:hypothetical protein
MLPVYCLVIFPELAVISASGFWRMDGNGNGPVGVVIMLLG